MNATNRVLARDQIGSAVVTTVFAGVDLRPIPGQGPPLVFETVVKWPHGDGVNRSATWEEAIESHRLTVDRVRRHLRN